MAKILIIDASAFMRGSLKYLLETAGHEIVGNTDDEKEVSTLYRALSPDLVTIDISMKGISILKEIMAIDPAAKVIMALKKGYETEKEDAVRFHARGFIEKPYNYEDIKSEVERVIGA